MGKRYEEFKKIFDEALNNSLKHSDRASHRISVLKLALDKWATLTALNKFSEVFWLDPNSDAKKKLERRNRSVGGAIGDFLLAVITLALALVYDVVAKSIELATLLVLYLETKVYTVKEIAIAAIKVVTYTPSLLIGGAISYLRQQTNHNDNDCKGLAFFKSILENEAVPANASFRPIRQLLIVILGIVGIATDILSWAGQEACRTVNSVYKLAEAIIETPANITTSTNRAFATKVVEDLGVDLDYKVKRDSIQFDSTKNCTTKEEERTKSGLDKYLPEYRVNEPTLADVIVIGSFLR